VQIHDFPVNTSEREREGGSKGCVGVCVCVHTYVYDATMTIGQLGFSWVSGFSMMMIIFSNFFVGLRYRATPHLQLILSLSLSLPLSVPLSIAFCLSLPLSRSSSWLLALAHVHLNVLGVLKYYYIKGTAKSICRILYFLFVKFFVFISQYPVKEALHSTSIQI